MTTPVHSVTRLDIAVVKTNPLGLQIEVEGNVGTPGWTGFALSHYLYVVPPADGIYEADMVGVPPSDNVLRSSRRFAIAKSGSPSPPTSGASKSIRRPIR
jgi:hypothetical protein